MRVNILNQEDVISPAFIKANRFILKKYHKLLKNNSVVEKNNTLEKLWKIEFNAELIKINKDDNARWEEIKFDSDLEKTLFLLKWG